MFSLTKPASWKAPITALAPRRMIVAWWYRLHGWTEPAPRARVPVLERFTSDDDAFKRIAFTFAVIALSARVAGAGGELTKEKYATFRDAFPLSGGLCTKLRSLFALAYASPAPFMHYVDQVKYAFPRQKALFESLVERLFCVASADGGCTRDAEHMLAKIAHRLELSPAAYARIRDHYVGHAPVRALHGDADTLKSRYRELMRRYHPDRFAHQSVSPEVALLLQLKSSEINQAYRWLSKKAA